MIQILSLVPFENGEEYFTFVKHDAWVFPGGEVGVKILDTHKVAIGKVVTISFNDTKMTSDVIMQFFNMVDAIRRINTECDIRVQMPYLPYGRQDRVCHEGESFALEVFAKLFDTLDEKVMLVVSDPHSYVTRELFGKRIILTNDQAFLVSMHVDVPDCIVFPDAGAAKKLQQYQDLKDSVDSYSEVEFFVYSKVRKDGEVIYSLPEDAKKPWGNVLVVDDICDGGATFLALAKAIRTPAVERLELMVTNGIFSKGVDILLQGGYDAVHAFNIPGIDNPGVKEYFETIH